MRLLCPYCQKPITVPDSEAGKTVNCPECHQQFAAPQLFTPPPSAFDQTRSGWTPAPPPAAESYETPPPTERSLPAEARQSTRPPREKPDLSAYQSVASLPFRPDVVRWIPAGAMTLVFLLTFFSWDGMYPAGYAAYTQSAWGSLFGSVGHDPVAEDQLKMLTDLQERVHSSLWILPYLLLLFPALAIAWAGPVVELAKVKLPPAVEPYWRYRPAALAGLLLLMFLFLLAQTATGFGIQKAIDRKVEDTYSTEKLAATTPEKEQAWQMKVDMAKGGYRARTTPWQRLAVLFHIVATLAAAGEAGLALRGTKPPPRVAALW